MTSHIGNHTIANNAPVPSILSEKTTFYQATQKLQTCVQNFCQKYMITFHPCSFYLVGTLPVSRAFNSESIAKQIPTSIQSSTAVLDPSRITRQ